MDWSHEFDLWQAALNENRRADAHEIIDQATKSIPRDKAPDRWDWFINAMESRNSADFVLAVFWRHPIPRPMMSHVLSAGVRFGNASSIKFYVLPCIETFGVDAVDRWFVERAPLLGLDNVSNKHDMAKYWYTSPTIKPRH